LLFIAYINQVDNTGSCEPLVVYLVGMVIFVQFLR
jgi:hypothetical protein